MLVNAGLLSRQVTRAPHPRRHNNTRCESAVVQCESTLVSLSLTKAHQGSLRLTKAHQGSLRLTKAH
eukprot:8801601-Pyramimonas_sp.AAC.1